MNVLVHVYDVVYYHKQGENGSLCVYNNLSTIWLCRFVTKLMCSLRAYTVTVKCIDFSMMDFLEKSLSSHSYQPITSICMLLMLLSRFEKHYHDMASRAFLD